MNKKYLITYYQKIDEVWKLCTYVCEDEWKMICFLGDIEHNDELSLVSVVVH